MVSLDAAVLARWEFGGKRYEILVDPDLVETFRLDPSSVNLDDFLATDEVWNDARGGDRPTGEAIESTFGTQDIFETFYDAGQFYWGKPDAWLKAKPIFSKKSGIIEISKLKIHDIDTLQDWKIAEKMWKFKNLK